jgi:hypothetical protein
MGRRVRNLKMNDAECDEIWGFVQKKESHKRPSEAQIESKGDAYTFVAIERDSELGLSSNPATVWLINSLSLSE